MKETFSDESQFSNGMPNQKQRNGMCLQVVLSPRVQQGDHCPDLSVCAYHKNGILLLFQLQRGTFRLFFRVFRRPDPLHPGLFQRVGRNSQKHAQVARNTKQVFGSLHTSWSKPHCGLSQ